MTGREAIFIPLGTGAAQAWLMCDPSIGWGDVSFRDGAHGFLRPTLFPKIGPSSRVVFVLAETEFFDAWVRVYQKLREPMRLAGVDGFVGFWVPTEIPPGGLCDAAEDPHGKLLRNGPTPERETDVPMGGKFMYRLPEHAEAGRSRVP
jgi:hypothetical protein